MNLTLVVLRCADLAKSRVFYEALGLRLTREQHGNGPEHWSGALDAGIVLELYPRGSRDTSGLRLGLAVADVEAALVAVRALGASTRGTVVTDPDGHQIELIAADRR
jgi:catechol 2,3-dioxygenase-like lactoylglutathione lyase family enzyme